MSAGAAVWAGPGLVAAAGVAMLAWTWRAWPDVLVDFGRELYVPWLLSEGRVLYRDLAYFNGPLSPYWNALWFRLAGPSFLTLVCANLVVLAATAGLLYAILARIGSRLGAAVGCLAFFPLFAFGDIGPKGNYTFIAPYSHDLVHGIALSLAGIYCVQRYQDSRGPRWVGGAGLATGLLFLTKVEVIAAGSAAVVVALALTLWRERPDRFRLLRLAGVFAVAAAAPIAIAFAAFATVMPLGRALSEPLGHWLMPWRVDITSLLFYREGLGILDTGLSARALLRSTGWHMAVLAPAALIALLLRRPGPHRSTMAAALFIAVTVVIGVQWWRIGWVDVARPLPLVVATAAVAWAAVLATRGWAGTDDRIALRLAMTVFALALLMKMVFNARIYHYGFALAMPATMLLVVALVDWIPALIERLGGYGPAFRAVAVAALLVTTVAHLAPTHRELRRRTVTVGVGHDAFLADGRGTFVGEAVRAIGLGVPRDRTLAVLPEGAMINFLARRPNPTPYFVFVPFEMLVYGEERILASFVAKPADYVMLVHRDTSEYGVQYFGRDYARHLYEWIMENYRPVAQFGAAPFVDGQFGIRLLRRRGLES